MVGQPRYSFLTNYFLDQDIMFCITTELLSVVDAVFGANSVGNTLCNGTLVNSFLQKLVIQFRKLYVLMQADLSHLQ